MNDKANGYVIKIKTNNGERYFYGFGKKGQVLTAWSLLGARIFSNWNDELAKIENRIKKKGLQAEKMLLLMETVIEPSGPAV